MFTENRKERITVPHNYQWEKHLRRVSALHRVSGKQRILPWMFAFLLGSRITLCRHPWGALWGRVSAMVVFSARWGVLINCRWFVIDCGGFSMDGFVMDSDNICFMCWLFTYFFHLRGLFITISVAFVCPSAPFPHSFSNIAVLRRCICKYISPSMCLMFIAPSTLLSSQWMLTCQWTYCLS